MNLSDQDVEEMNSTLFQTSLSLEELICSIEGILPHRVIAIDQKLGYHDAKKLVLNDARTQLRRAKTFMLRVGALKAIAQTSASAQGDYPATVEKADITRPAPAPQHLEWPKDPLVKKIKGWIRETLRALK